jgi:hypothetical protein
LEWVPEPIGNPLRREENGSDQNQIDPQFENEIEIETKIEIKKIVILEIGETSHEIEIVAEIESFEIESESQTEIEQQIAQLEQRRFTLERLVEQTLERRGSAQRRR